MTEERAKEISDIIITSSQIYANIINQLVQINGEIISIEDKQKLALFHGIESTNNSFSKILKKLNYFYKINIDKNIKDSKSKNYYSYKITINKDLKKGEDAKSSYYKIFINIIKNFNLLDENAINEIALYLLDLNVIKKIHEGHEKELENIKKEMQKQKTKKFYLK